MVTPGLIGGHGGVIDGGESAEEFHGVNGDRLEACRGVLAACLGCSLLPGLFSITKKVSDGGCRSCPKLQRRPPAAMRSTVFGRANLGSMSFSLNDPFDP